MITRYTLIREVGDNNLPLYCHTPGDARLKMPGRWTSDIEDCWFADTYEHAFEIMQNFKNARIAFRNLRVIILKTTFIEVDQVK